MRASQLWHWIYHRGAREFPAMRNIARPVLERLAERYTLARPKSSPSRSPPTAPASGCCACRPAHRFDKGAEIECVYIPESDRGTLCVSSQVGCTLNCSFCHTGTMPLVRNLTAAEIVGQVLVARDRLGDFPGGVAPAGGLVPKGEGVRAVSNIVFMGMGEPLYNFEAVRDAIAILTDGDGLSLSKRRITVSTSGVVARDGEARGRMRDDARGVAARDQQCAARQARAAQPEISARDAARGLPQLSRAPPTPGASRSNT